MNDTLIHPKQAVKIICPSCGGEFEDTMPKCPYCETLHIKGAEAEYMEKLEDVRSDMAQLGEVPEAETKKELKKQGKLVGIIFAVLAAIVLLGVIWFIWNNREEKRDVQAEYLWKQENFPIMEELYEQEEYDELLKFYRDALMNDTPVMEWENVWFCEVLERLDDMDYFWRLKESGEKMIDGDYTSFLYNGWRFKNGKGTWLLTEEQVERLTPEIEQAMERFEDYWQFDEEDLAGFEREMAGNDGYVSYEYCQKYVKTWRKEHE